MGYQVYETSQTQVLHDGFRKHEEGRQLSWRYAFGIGASYSKPFRAGHWRFSVVLAYELLLAARPLVMDALRLKRPRGFMRILGLVQGFARGLITPVDRRTLRFVDTRVREPGPAPASSARQV
jgi:hypothetical protein